MVIPMLDESEYAIVQALYREGMRATKEFREAHNLPLKDVKLEELFKPCLSAYEQITGFHETNANAVMHHRLSMFGQPCPKCGKPFRTSKASGCVEEGCPTNT
jgi:hypothetical protein